jgi:uncharacterized protein
MTIREPFEAILSRRQALLGAGALTMAAAAPPAWAARGNALDFDDLPSVVIPGDAVAKGYDAQVLIRWGDPVVSGAPAFAPGAVTSSAQERQFGMNNDFVGFFPMPWNSNNSAHGLLAVNHEFSSPKIFYAGKTAETISEADVRAEMATIGLSVIEVRRGADGEWRVVENSAYGRRVTPMTPMRLGGPVAGHPRARTAADPSGTTVLGTLANCAGGKTPWGTVITAEENYQNYFRGAPPKDHPEAGPLATVGIKGEGKMLWGKYETRFDAGVEPNEANRFGYMVEFDPYDPASMPIKRTHLGRFRHEAASIVIAKDGRVVAYLGEDRVNGGIFRFISKGRYRANMSKAEAGALLDEGELSVARFSEKSLRWIPLVPGQGPLSRYETMGDLLIETQTAAELAGGTPMDRPEDMEVNPVNGFVYVNLTRGEARETPDPANPRARNKDGHILEIIPPGGDHTAAEFDWNVLLLCGTADTGARYGRGTRTVMSGPDNIAFDPKGRLWIATDNNRWDDPQMTIPNGLFACEVDGQRRARVKFFYNVPEGSELCGPEFTPDGRTLFVAVQHPENSKTPDKGNWPDWTPGLPPRASVVAITRRNGGPIGG